MKIRYSRSFSNFKEKTTKVLRITILQYYKIVLRERTNNVSIICNQIKLNYCSCQLWNLLTFSLLKSIFLSTIVKTKKMNAIDITSWRIQVTIAWYTLYVFLFTRLKRRKRDNNAIKTNIEQNIRKDNT